MSTEDPDDINGDWWETVQDPNFEARQKRIQELMDSGRTNGRAHTNVNVSEELL